ncbi:hypothetical protein ACI65C_003494 [Semiaphis heraclei]
MLIVSGLYYSPNNIFASVEYGWKGMTSMFLTYRLWIVVYHSNDVWNCLTITRYDFASHNLRDRHILDRWRKRSVLITNTLAIVYFTTTLFFTGIFLIFRNDIMTIKFNDGSVGHYQQNLLNLFLIVTDETYNAYYGAFYFIEVLFAVLMANIIYVFDMLLVTLCLAVSCQMQMINAAFESFGNKSPSDPNTPIIVTLTQSVSIQFILNNDVNEGRKLSLSGEDKFVDSEVSTIKMFCLIPSVTFQLFMMCSLFDNLNKQVICNPLFV